MIDNHMAKDTNCLVIAFDDVWFPLKRSICRKTADQIIQAPIGTLQIPEGTKTQLRNSSSSFQMLSAMLCRIPRL